MSLVAGCASQPAASQLRPGFGMGFLNELVAPIALSLMNHCTRFISLFSADIRIYAFPNSGVWYDFGFLLGLAAWGGGGAVATSGSGGDGNEDEVHRLRRKVRRLRRRLRGF